MPRLRLEVDQETYNCIAEQAVSERRPVDLQAEVMLRRAAGLPFPVPAEIARAGKPAGDQ